MVFSSILFIFYFLFLFILVYFFNKNRTYRNIVLLLFSLLFYAYGEPLYIILMIFSILVNYFLGLLINKYNNKIWFYSALIFNIGLLLFFKYFDFFISITNNIFNVKVNYLNIILPIGISFYTFQILSYIIDVYKKKVQVQKNVLNLGCYICAFPQLIAGPIVRYSTVNKELSDRRENIFDFSDGLRRFVLGLGKKVLIANSVAYIANHVLNLGFNNYGLFGSILIVISYTLQIYYDFSGYSDMAIGLGKMFGFHYLENFDYPYSAKSITEFWHKWHISLSSFFKDYVYIPLGGNRVSKSLNIRNILIVWLLTGLWHGASINFVLWGLYYGIILLIEKYLLKNWLAKLPKFIKHIYTLTIIIFGWIIFMATDLSLIKDLSLALIGNYGLGNINSIIYTGVLSIRYIMPLIVGLIFCFPLYKKIEQKLNKNLLIKDLFILFIFILSIWLILVDSYNPFIYFRF